MDRPTTAVLDALVKARDALADLNQAENDDGALLAEIDAAIAQEQLTD